LRACLLLEHDLSENRYPLFGIMVWQARYSAIALARAIASFDVSKKSACTVFSTS
jgi:hypothetical protein